jgi:hypothetical protein
MVTPAVLLTAADAQQGTQTSIDEEFKQNFVAEHEIGHRFQIDPADPPAPKTGPTVTNRSLVVPYSGQAPSVPDRFTASPFANGLVNPRRLLVLLMATCLSRSRAPDISRC